MADNTTLPGTGDVISTDDISGVKVQRVKVQYGSDGSATDVALGTPLPASPRSATGTGSNVSGSLSSVNLLASNTARLGFTIYNDSTAVLYVKFGTTASSTDFLVRIAAGGYFEGPFGHTGRVDGIWASATGTARIVELT